MPSVPYWVLIMGGMMPSVRTNLAHKRYDYRTISWLQNLNLSFQQRRFPFFSRTFPATRARGSRDLRPRVTRPAPAGHATCARGSLALCREKTRTSRSETRKSLEKCESRLEKSKSRLEKSLRCRHGNRTVVSFSISFRRVAHRSVKTKCMGAGATNKQEEHSESPTRFFKAWKSELWD